MLHYVVAGDCDVVDVDVVIVIEVCVVICVAYGDIVIRICEVSVD